MEVRNAKDLAQFSVFGQKSMPGPEYEADMLKTTQ
jgi:hypothetical protein